MSMAEADDIVTQHTDFVTDDTLTNGSKRAREDEELNDDVVLKKQKVDDDDDKSVEEVKEDVGAISLGPKCFGSSLQMFDYFYALLHHWPPNHNLNKYEYMVLLELLKKGHAEPERKIGRGIQAFQVRYHPMFKSKCFFLVRDDDTADDFSFRKCVDKILTLPEDMKTKFDANKSHGGRNGNGGRGGRGGGGKSRN